MSLHWFRIGTAVKRENIVSLKSHDMDPVTLLEVIMIVIEEIIGV